MLQAVPSAPPLWQPSPFSRAGGLKKAPHNKAGRAIAKEAASGETRESTPDAAALSRLLVAVGSTKDKTAFAELFRHFAPRLKGYLLRLGGDAAAAEEAMQEAMVLVWRKAEQFDPAKANASTWIFTIARNVRIDSFRRERRPEFDPDDPALVPDPEEQPDASLARGQSAVMVREALTRLSEAERAVLHLSFFEDLSHSMIATKLGVPLGTVKSRLRLAFGKLRGELSELEGTG
jgi:RNA polymerase sigma-70 factor (ECF subfamily)